MVWSCWGATLPSLFANSISARETQPTGDRALCYAIIREKSNINMISRFTLEIPVHWQVCYNLLNLVSTIFKLAQRVKKKVKALFKEMIVQGGYWERRLPEFPFRLAVKIREVQKKLDRSQLRGYDRERRNAEHASKLGSNRSGGKIVRSGITADPGSPVRRPRSGQRIAEGIYDR